MDNDLYFVITSGYALQNNLGWDEPCVFYAGYNQTAAEAALHVLQQIGKSCRLLGGKWLPMPATNPGITSYAVPEESFLIKASDHTNGRWAAIVTEEKNFPLPRDTKSFANEQGVFTPQPTDFRACSELRFYAVTKDHLNTILTAHHCGTDKSDHKVVYFMPGPETLLD